MEISSRDSQFREDALSYIEALGGAIMPGEAEAATMEQPVEGVNDSPALQSLIESMDPSVSTRVQEVAQ